MCRSPAPPIRIAFCITDLDAGGAERSLVQIVTRLDRARWEPSVFCLAGEGELAPLLRDAGIAVTCFGANPRNLVTVVGRLSHRLWRLRPAILQTFLYHANVVGRFAGKLARVPHLVAGIRVAERRSRFRLWLDRATDWMVETHVCVSRDVASFSIHDGGLPASKMRVIPNGVDVTRFVGAMPADLTQFDIPPGSRTLLFVGRLDPQKGPTVLLAAVQDLLRLHADLHVLLVGDGPLREELRMWVKNAGLEGQVHFAGRRNDVASLLRSARLFVLPSLWEGLPNVVLEAMAAGVPVIATQVEGISDLVLPDQTGVVVPPNSPAQLAAGIASLLSNPDKAQSMARSAQRHVIEGFTWVNVIAQYEQLYCQLLGRGDVENSAFTSASRQAGNP